MDLSRHSRRDQILISLMLQDAANKQLLRERLDEEVRAMQHLCRAQGLFAELVLPLWRNPAEIHLHLTREFLWLVVLDDLGTGVERRIRDVASLAMLTYSD